MHQKLSLLARFSLVGLVITVTIGIGLAWGIEQHLEQTAREQEAAEAADQVAGLLGPRLRVEDVAGPLDPVRYSQIDELIRQFVLRGHIVHIKIWGRDGTLLYSDETELVGSRFPVNEDLDKALAGETTAHISDLQKAENVQERAQFARLMEIYVPLRVAGSPTVVGAYEVYHSLTDVDRHNADMRRLVWSRVGLSFLILYAALFTIVRNASRELVLRNAENARLLTEEQARHQELAALYDISRAVAGTAYDIDAILHLIAKRAVETIRVTFARVALLEGDDIVVHTAYPIRTLDRDLDVGRREPVAACPSCQRALASRAPIVLSADDGELSSSERSLLSLGLAKTLCLVPLHIGDRAVGVLLLCEQRGDQREPFTAEKMSLASSIGDLTASALHRAELFADLERSYLQTVLALANAMDARDPYTGNHAESLAVMALAVGRALGLDAHKLEDLRYGAILHDIGKIGVPDSILQKPAKLTADEWILMRQHPVIGAEIVVSVPRLAAAAQVIRHHHERYDGTGYPDGLAGEAIPLSARIVTVVDSYSAIIDRRAYKPARPRAEAVAELRLHAGAQFDSHIVEVFLGLLEHGLDAA